MSRNIPLKVKRKEDVSILFAESFQLLQSVAGFKLVIFNDIAEYANEPRVGSEAMIPRAIVKEIVAEINFSPQQLKILSKIISQQLHNYETQIGEIKLPEKHGKKDNTAGAFI
ncbi:MAG: hypothetical protein ACTSYD_14220 [Candidatus Heimdallarchaeaceae archaeon]